MKKRHRRLSYGERLALGAGQLVVTYAILRAPVAPRAETDRARRVRETERYIREADAKIRGAVGEREHESGVQPPDRRELVFLADDQLAARRMAQAIRALGVEGIDVDFLPLL